MKIINIGKQDIEYPFGKNIQKANNYINNVINKYIIREKSRIIILWCRGSSGAIAASIFSVLMSLKYPEIKIYINHIKKEGEYSHSSRHDYVMQKNSQHIIIDDFVDTGVTLFSILDEMYIVKRNFKDINIIVSSLGHNPDVKNQLENNYNIKNIYCYDSN